MNGPETQAYKNGMYHASEKLLLWHIFGPVAIARGLPARAIANAIDEIFSIDQLIDSINFGRFKMHSA